MGGGLGENVVSTRGGKSLEYDEPVLATKISNFHFSHTSRPKSKIPKEKMKTP
jgi:hypothetical protein